MENRRNHFPIKPFIPASECSRSLNVNNYDESSAKGIEISEFYESTCMNNNGSSLRGSSGESNSRQTLEAASKIAQVDNFNKAPSLSKINHNTLMKSAELNDLEGVSLCLSRGLDVNGRDAFGWTALMSAACSGAKEAVMLLLDNNADRKISDAKGRTALKLAYKRKHFDVVEILFQKKIKTENEDNAQNEREETSREFCETCEVTVEHSADDNSHNTSTAHQFNHLKKLPDGSTVNWANYRIPSNNVGFQMMLKTGWDMERGLGPEGSGARYPPKTLLKRDREGLGSNHNRQKARVTHFEAGDVRAVQHRPPINTQKFDKRAQQRQRNKDRVKAIEFRREFHTCD